MFAQHRHRARLKRLALHFEARTEHRNRRLMAGHLRLEEQAAFVEVRMAGDLLQVAHHGHHVGCGELCLQRFGRMLGDHSDQGIPQRAVIGHARGMVDKARIGEHLGPAKATAEFLKLRLQVGTQHDVTVDRLVQIGGGNSAIAAIAGTLGQFAGVEMGRHHAAHHLERAIQHQHVDKLALARMVAPPQRGQDRDHRHVPGEGVEDREAYLDRTVLGLAVHPHQPAHGLHHLVERAPVTHRTGMPEAGDRAIDQARVDRLERIPVKPQRGWNAGAEILDHDVRSLGQPSDDTGRLGRLHVESDGLFPGVGRRERQAHARRSGMLGIVAKAVAGSRPLHLHHVRVKQAHHRGAGGTRHHVAEIEDADFGKRLHGHSIVAVKGIRRN